MRIYAPIILFCIALITIPLTAQPDDPISRNRAGERLHQALYHIHAQAQASGWTSDLNRLAGDIYAQMNDIPRAVVYWERADLSDPARLELLAGAYVELQQWDYAIATLNRLLSAESTHQWGLWQWSALTAPSMDESKLPLVNARLQQLIASPDFGEIVAPMLGILASERIAHEKSLQLGILFGTIERWDLAEFAFEHAARLHISVVVDSNDALETAYVGLARYMQGKPAQDWFSRALATDPTHDQIHYVYSIYLRNTGDLSASQQAIANAISLNPNNPAYYFELGMIYYALSDVQQGDYWIQFAQTIGGQSDTLLRLIDDFYAQQQQDFFDFDALQALLDATPEVTPEATLEITPEITPAS
jgi:tetratricopeptide (TPR) repeat protein